MARDRDRPAWLRDLNHIRAIPVERPGQPVAGLRKSPGATEYEIACTVSGLNSVIVILWWAQDLYQAEATFQEWLDQSWAVLDRTFFDWHEDYKFRTGAITGFVVHPQ